MAYLIANMATTKKTQLRIVQSGYKPTTLKQWRLRHGLSQDEAAAKVGVHLVTYIRLERGVSPRPVGSEVARKVAAVTKRSVGQVIDEYESRRADTQRRTA